MHVTTIIVNWQRPQDTIECLRSVVKSRIREHRILVVDNGSGDDSGAQLRDAFPNIEIVELPQNRGFSGGYNAGIQRALERPTERLFLLNNDTTIKPDTISNLLAAPWDIAIPKILYHDEPTRIWAAGAKWRWLPPSVKMIGYQQPDQARFQVEIPLDYATGCALLLSRRVADTLGGFDPAFENYMEDYDFFYRAKQAGFRTGYVPDAVVYHKVSRSLGANSPQQWRYMGRNTVLFYRKNRRFPAWMLASFVTWVTLRETLKGNWTILRSYWRGIRNGLKTLEGDG